MRGDWQVIPFALQLLEQHWNGKTVEQLSRETGIPSDRIKMRLNAADLYLQWLSESGGTGTTLSEERRRHNNGLTQPYVGVLEYPLVKVIRTRKF